MRQGDDAALTARVVELEAALAEEIRRSEALNRIAEAIGSGIDLQHVVQAVVDGGVELTGATFGAVVYNGVEAGGDGFTLYSLSGVPREAFAGFTMPGRTAIFAPILEGQGVVRSDDITQDPRYGHNPPFQGMPEGHPPVRAYLAAPVVTRGGEVLGGLVFGHSEPGRFSPRTESLVIGLAAQAAVAIESMRAVDAALRELDHRRGAEERLKFALESGRLGAWELDVATRAYEASDICKANYGRGAEESFGFDDLVASIIREDRPRMIQAIEDAIDRGAHYDIEYRVRTPNGDSRWVHARGRAAQTADHGGARRMAGVSLDITDRKRAEDRQRLLLNELNHRVKNTLVSVQSIARQTLRNTPDPAAFNTAFEARLMALSKTHNLLTDQNWEGASLREVFDAETEAFAARDRMSFAYSRDVRLNPKSTVALGLAVHELATNALKYGALSTATGEVQVKWTIEAGEVAFLCLTWRERGGPPVADPDRLGFGGRLLEKGLARELCGEVSLDYNPNGLVCTMRLPIRALEA